MVDKHQSKWQYDSLSEFVPNSVKQNHLLQKCFAEFVGTFFIVVFGVGSVCSAVLAGQLTGLWQVTVVWGFGVALAIYCTASISGGHLNPAVSLALAILRPKAFPWRELWAYWAAQFLGGIAGGFVNLLVFHDYIKRFEKVRGIDRGEDASVFSAMLFGEYFPNPTMSNLLEPREDLLGFHDTILSMWYALFIEGWGTAILMFVILAATDKRQKAVHPQAAPFLIGFTVAVVMSLYAPMTQGGLNPARDFGPRLVAVMCGWGKIAIPGPRNGFWIYVIGPLVGAPIGGLLYDLLIAGGMDIQYNEDSGVELLFSRVMPDNAEYLGDINTGDDKLTFAKARDSQKILFSKTSSDVANVHYSGP